MMNLLSLFYQAHLEPIKQDMSNPDNWQHGDIVCHQGRLFDLVSCENDTSLIRHANVTHAVSTQNVVWHSR